MQVRDPLFPSQSPEMAQSGLSSEEAQRLLGEVGPNEPSSRRHTAFWEQLAPQLTNPLVIILLIASAIAATLGEVTNAIIISVIVLLSIAINVTQTYRSQQAVERLRQGIAPTATVLRDNSWQELARRDIVPGDLIRLMAGDLIPADATLLEAHDLHLHEAALTGESLPVEKHAIADSEKPSEETTVYLGTSVVSGTAIARVTATGGRTAFGDIAARLADRPPETEFERGIRRFGYLIMRTVMFLVLFVFLVGVAFKHSPFESLLFAIALAVGLTPEFLPMITTVTLGQGAIHMAKKRVIVKHLPAIQNFGSIDILCSDKTGTLTSGAMSLTSWVDLHGQESAQVLLMASLNSLFDTGIKSPLDLAIMQQTHPGVDAFRKLDEIPFDFERRRLSVVVTAGTVPMLITKGAPETILPLCTSYQDADATQPLGSAERVQCESAYQRLSKQGFRVLAVASRAVPEQAAYTLADERDLTFLGFVTFADPPLEDAAETLRDLSRDGIQLKIVSGDNDLVARHVCEEVGIDVRRIVVGSELERMTDAALRQVVEEVSVFARVSPAQKNRIILALHKNTHVVGFLGDGINDAPSLHTADVGISVASAVDVAREAADIILLDRNLEVLHQGIIEGRKSFGNVIKYLLMGTSSNFGNMFSMAAAFVFLPFLPMLPTQILLNNFMYDLSQMTIPTDTVDESFIRKPRRWDITLIRNFMIVIGPISSIFDFLTFFLLLQVFHAPQEFFHTGWFVESLATQTLVLFVIRTAHNPLRSRPSTPLTITVIGVVLLGMLLPLTPLARVLGFVPLPWAFWPVLLIMIAIYLFLVEIVKRRLFSDMLA